MSRRERQLELADALRFEGELRHRPRGPTPPRRSSPATSSTSENQSSGCSLQADVAARAGVVVDGHRNRDAIALRQGDRQIEIDEEILKDFEAGRRRCRARPCSVEASIAMRQVVMESAIGIVMLAPPSRSVMISGLM